ncbi:MAG: 23S rRNA (uracil(1939)-C(5))-methyltransferase RlmD [Mycoplasmatales bacterium]
MIHKGIEVIDYTSTGLGVCKVEGFPYFIQYAKIGDVIDFEVIKTENNYAIGKLLELENNSECPHYLKCNGCSIAHLDYDEQLTFKHNVVKNLLSKFKISTRLEAINANYKQFEYRNKVVMPFVADKNIKVGYFKPGSKDIEPIKDCRLFLNKTNILIETILNLLNEMDESVYDYKFNQGNLKHLIIKQSNKDLAYMIIIVTKDGTLNNKHILIDNLKEEFNIDSVVINENPDDYKQQGLKNYIVYRKEFIVNEMNNIRFKVTPNSFYQVNNYQAKELMNYAINLINLNNKTVLDAFCGTGLISLLVSKQASKVYGIDSNFESIEIAKENAKFNCINNVTFKASKVEKETRNLEQSNFFDVVFVDPPRKGVDKDFISLLLKKQPENIIYISCNQSTLCRDLNLLSTKFNVISTKPFDMFPNTHHIESVTLLQRK